MSAHQNGSVAPLSELRLAALVSRIARAAELVGEAECKACEIGDVELTDTLALARKWLMDAGDRAVRLQETRR